MTEQGKRIREERERLGLTRAELGSKAGLNQSFISALENGRRLPGKQTLEKVAKALQIPASKLKVDIKERATAINHRESCEGCYYRRRGGTGGVLFETCDYCLVTGRPRGSPPDKCDKKLLRSSADAKRPFTTVGGRYK